MINHFFYRAPLREWALILCIFGTFQVSAQENIQDSSIHLTLLNVTYHGLATGGDMADRFGLSHTVGLGVGHKFPNNLYLQTGFNFLLGGPVREDSILRHLEAAPGLLITDDGLLTGVRLTQLGFIIPVTVGKVFPVFPKQNPNSGFYVEIGGQFIQHEIQTQISDGNIAGLNKQQQKGYDRLTNGIGIREGIGYKFFSNSGYLNFSIGLDVSQNFTRNRRAINVDTGMTDFPLRMDHLVGIEASWIFLIYNKAANAVYYN